MNVALATARIAPGSQRPDPAAGIPEPDGPVTKEAMMARGEKVYGKICAACHQGNGQGVEGQYPPLAGAGEYYGDAKNHADEYLKLPIADTSLVAAVGNQLRVGWQGPTAKKV